MIVLTEIYKTEREMKMEGPRLSAGRYDGGHPKTQTMQTADRRPCKQIVQTEYFVLLILVFAFTFDSNIFWFCSIICWSVCYPQAVQTRWYVSVDVL